jgi:DNA polymerase-3 subunit gamma/tau
VRQMLGAVDRHHALGLVEALARRDGAAVIAAVDKLRELGLSASGTLEEMATLLQDMAIRQAVPEGAGADPTDAEEVARIATLLPADETQLLYSIVLHGRAEIGLAPDEYSGLLMVLLRLLAFPPQADGNGARMPCAVRAAGAPRSAEAAVGPAAVDAANVAATGPGAAAEPRRAPSRLVERSDVKASPMAPARASAGADLRVAAPASRAVPARPESVRPAVDAGAPPTPASSTHSAEAGSASAGSLAASVAAKADSVAPELGDRWAEVVQQLCSAGSIVAMVRELAMQAQCVAIDEAVTPPCWRLRLDREMLRAPAQCEKLQAALSEHLGRKVRIETVAGAAEDSPARREAAERARRQAEAEKTIQNDPLVQALMAQYKTARIVPGSVRSL